MIMDNENKNINLILQQDADTESELSLSIITVLKQLKRFLAWWLVVAIVGAVCVGALYMIKDKDTISKSTALVNFGFDGIEKGLDPQGAVFDPQTIKSPLVIDKALQNLGFSSELLNSTRDAIKISSIIPQDALDKITVYKGLYSADASYSMNAAKEMLATSYYPTQFKITMNNKLIGVSSEDGEALLNEILNCYRDNFFETYGFNRALGNAVSVSGYEDYDFSEAIEIFDNSLRTMKSYVSQLSKNDTTRFRSVSTGYTFADLTQAIDTLITVDLDFISSYVNVNNITKDKENLITYYQYQIDYCTRQKNINVQTLASIDESIKNYVKDSMVIMGGTNPDGTTPTLSQSSEAYDELFLKKTETQTAVASFDERVNYYTARIESLKTATSSTSGQIKTVEDKLAKINEKSNEIMDKINKTTDEYYETVTFANAFKVTVPPSSKDSTISDIVSNLKKPVLIIELLIIAVYFCVAVIMAIKSDYFKSNAAKASGSNTPANDADDESQPESTGNNQNQKKGGNRK